MSADPADKLGAFLKKLGKKFGEQGGVRATDLFPDERLIADSITNEIVVSMLIWESSFSHAAKAFERIRSDLVDLNELRVCTGDELMSIMGTRMPRSSERALRLLSILNTVYERENTLELGHLREMNKRDVLAYLSGIDGLPQYAIARVLLLDLGLHAIPLDERLSKKLVGESVLDSSQTLEQQASVLERAVRANDSLETYRLLEHWGQESRTVTKSRKSTKSTPATKGASS